MNKKFDIERTLAFIDRTNQRDFDMASATRYLHVLIKDLSMDEKLKPTYIFPQHNGDAILGFMCFTLQEIYIKWLYENDYYLPFTYKEFRDAFNYYLGSMDMKPEEKVSDEELQKSGLLNVYASEHIKKYFKLEDLGAVKSLRNSH